LEDVYSCIDNLFKNNKYLEYGKEAKINAENFLWDRIIENYKRIL
jgi:phosphatidylinositol alpha-1,6-mannosyltransferase